jgi:mRNA interferase MazF
VKRGDVFRSREPVPERGHKPGFYIVVSREFICSNPDVSTVVCAPVYSRILGLTTEVLLGPDHGLPHASAARCDFLTLMFKRSLTAWVGSLRPPDLRDLDRALVLALGISEPH